MKPTIMEETTSATTTENMRELTADVLTGVAGGEGNLPVGEIAYTAVMSLLYYSLGVRFTS